MQFFTLFTQFRSVWTRFHTSNFPLWSNCKIVVKKKNLDDHVIINVDVNFCCCNGEWGRVTAQLCGYKGLNYTSPTLASALSNLIPAFTFILAIIFRCMNCKNIIRLFQSFASQFQFLLSTSLLLLTFTSLIFIFVGTVIFL